MDKNLDRLKQEFIQRGASASSTQNNLENLKQQFINKGSSPQSNNINSNSSVEERISLAESKLETAKAKRKAAVNSRPGLVLINGKPKMQTSTAMAEADREITNARYELESAQREKYFSEQESRINKLTEEAKQSGNYQQTLTRIQQQDEAAEQIDNKRKMNRSAGLYDFHAGRGSSQYAFMTDEEKAVYDTLRVSNPQGAREYAEYLQYVLNERVAQNEAETLDEMGTVGNILGYVGAGLTAPKTLITQGYNAIRSALSDEYQPVDYNSPGYRSARIQTEAMENVVGDIENPTLNFLASLGLDLLSMAVTRGFGGAVGGRFASAVSRGMNLSQAGGRTAYEAGEEGTPATDAFALGALNGLVEYVTEKVPIDRFFSLIRSGSKSVGREAVANILKQAGLEGSEELISSYLQTLNDIAIRGDNSQWGRTVDAYMAEGLSREEAERKANIDSFVLDPMLSFVGGALGGGVFGGAGVVINNTRNRNNDIDFPIDNNNNYPYDTSRGDLNDVENIGERAPGGETRGMPREERSSGTGYDGELLHNPTRETGVLSEESGRGLSVGSATGSDGGNGESSAVQGNRISGLSPEQQQRLEGTSITDDNGIPILTFHWTSNMNFDEFGEGDIGFHFGSENQANQRAINLNQDPNNGRLIKAYLNIQNPAIVTTDQLGWNSPQAAFTLWRNGYLTEAEYSTILDLSKNDDGRYNSPSSIALRQMLADKGYDGIIYRNDFEGGGDSYIALYPEQIMQVSDTPQTNNNSDNNKEEGPQVSDAEAPNDTPEAAHALLSSNLNISQNSEEINSDQGQNSPPTDSFRTPEGEGETVANQFAENSLQKAAEAGTVNKKIADALEGSTHQRVSNQQLIEQAQKAITDNNPGPVARYLRDKVNRGSGLNSVETTAGLMLIEDYSRQGNVQAATDLADTMMQASSDGARALQALKLIQKNLPGSFITLANKTLARKGLPMLNETEVNTINALQTLANEADNIMAIENAEQRQAAIDEIIANVDPQYQKYINKLFNGKNKKDLSDWFLLLTQKVVSDKTPATLTDKIRSWQRINLLLNPKTNIRNVLGNTLFSTAELLGNTTVAPWIDRLLSLRTGQRTATLPQMNEYVRGMAQGARDTATAARTGTLSMLGNRYSDAPNSATRPFKNKILSGLDNATTAALTFGDKIFSGAREADIAAQLRKINPNLSDAEIAEIAHQLALEITFQDDSGMAKFLLKIRNAISGEGKRNTSQQEENTPQKIGNRTREAISYATLPFAKTPANILNQVMNYSPLGLANGITKAVRVATQGKNASPMLQRQAVDAISRGLVGSGLMGIGTLLASLGLASGGSSEEDKRYREANGISDNSIKFSIGDKDYWIDFSSLGPVPTAINTGATIWNELQKITDGGTAFDIVKQLFTAPVNDITQDDLWSGIIDLVGYLGEGDTERALEEVLGDAVTQAVPLGSFLRMITGTIDPYTRETSGETEADWTLNRIVSQLPGASNTLPIKYDALGEPVKRYTAADNLGERLLWSSIMPGNASLDRSDNPVIQETNKIYASTGDTSVLPQNAPYSIQYGGETHQVVGQNRSDYAKTAGQFASQSILDVLDSPTYINASDEEKADILSAIIGVGKEDARRDYFGTEGIPYDATTTASNQLDFVNNMEQYGLTSGDAVALYKGVRNEDTTSNAAKAKAILDSGLTGVQKIAAANELFSDSSDTFISNLSEAIMRGVADEWVQLYGLVQDKENNEYAYSEEFINAYFDLLTQGMSPSDKQWMQSTLRRWRMIPQEIF